MLGPSNFQTMPQILQWMDLASLFGVVPVPKGHLGCSQSLTYLPFVHFSSQYYHYSKYPFSICTMTFMGQCSAYFCLTHIV